MDKHFNDVPQLWDVTEDANYIAACVSDCGEFVCVEGRSNISPDDAELKLNLSEAYKLRDWLNRALPDSASAEGK